MGKILLVGLGGFIGSILRYLFSGYIQQLSQSSSYPVGTLAVNAAGCLLIGFLSQLVDVRGVFTPEIRLLVLVGVLGGFTTFSTFGNETLNLAQDGQTFSALMNIFLHLGLGLGFVWLGRAGAHLLWR